MDYIFNTYFRFLSGTYEHIVKEPVRKDTQEAYMRWVFISLYIRTNIKDHRFLCQI